MLRSLGASQSPRRTQAGLIPLHSCPGLSLAAFLYLVIFPSLPKHNNSKYSQLPDNKQSQGGQLPDGFVPTYGLIQGRPDWALGTGHLSQAGWMSAHRPPQLHFWNRNPRIPQLWGALSTFQGHFPRETEAQKGQVTCLRPHSSAEKAPLICGFQLWSRCGGSGVREMCIRF